MFVPQVGGCIGRYVLEEELGRGGMAIVFRASDPSLGREVAIKVMHAHLWGTPEYAARFAREARAVAALRHPNIVEIFDYSEGSGTSGDDAVPGYIVSELVRGPTLRQFLDLHGRPLPEVAALLGLKLAEALSCAHQRGIVHRDLKPENVMIAERGRVVLTDFGIARITEGEAVTQTGALIGSPAYMSPEQARGLHVDARADLFSLGVVLYQLCTGTLPFPGKDPISTVLRVLEGTFEPPLKLNPQIGGRMDRLLRRLLQVDPARRPASADELAGLLRELLAEASIVDFDAELRAYFDGPGEYNQTLVPRIVETAITQAEQAMAQKDAARALRLCDRVLAFVPDDARALALVQRQQKRKARWPLLLGLATVVAAGASWGLIHWRARHDPSGAVLPPTSRPVVHVVRPALRPDAALARDVAVAPDLAPDRGRRGPRGKSGEGKSGATKGSRKGGPAPLAAADARVAPRVDARARPVLQPVADEAELVVHLGPFCDLSVDGRPAGRSPLAAPLKLKPGTHQVVCVHAPTGAVYRQEVRLVAGQRKTLSGTVLPRARVRLQLTQGDAVRIDGKTTPAGGSLQLPAGRYRVELLKQGAVVGAEWLTVMRDCTLADQPRLECR